MSAAISGLTPLDPGQLVSVSLDDLKAMSIPDLVAFAHQVGVDVHRVTAERGKLLTELLKRVTDV